MSASRTFWVSASLVAMFLGLGASPSGAGPTVHPAVSLTTSIFAQTSPVDFADCPDLSPSLSRCSGTGYASSPNGLNFERIEYRTRASASFGTLRVETSLRVASGLTEAEVPAASVGEALAIAHAYAQFTDVLTVFGGAAGDAGILTVAFHLGGSIVNDPSGGPFRGSSAAAFGWMVDGGRAMDGHSFDREGRVDGLVFMNIPFQFEQEFELMVDLWSTSGYGGTDEPATRAAFVTSADFFDTATLTSVAAFDSHGRPVAFRLSAASGSTEFERFGSSVVTVPTPSTAPLMLLGVGLLFCWRRLAGRPGPGRMPWPVVSSRLDDPA